MSPLRLLAVLVALVAACVVAPPAGAATFTVTSAFDDPDEAPGDGLCAIEDQPLECTLRAAIQSANAAPGPDTIAFDLAEHELTIQPGDPLPPITGTIDIDGRTQPGFSGAPLVEISGSLLPDRDGPPQDPDGQVRIRSPYGLELRGDESRIDSVVVNEFPTAIVAFNGSDGSRMINSYIGTDRTGTQDRSRAQVGVYLPASADTTIGGTTIDERNVIAGSFDDVIVSGDGSQGNRIVGNHIGLDPAGTGVVGPALGDDRTAVGILVTRDGTHGPAHFTQVVGNLVAGPEVGIRAAYAFDTDILANRVGMDRVGMTAGMGAEPYESDLGIDVVHAHHTHVGSDLPGAGNVVAATREIGVRVAGAATDTTVAANRLGTDAGAVDLRDPLGNSTSGHGWGVLVAQLGDDAPQGVLVGGDTAAAGNVIAGGDADGDGTGGVGVRGSSADVRVLSNVLGADRDGRVAADMEVVGPAIVAFPDGLGRGPQRLRVGAPGAANLIPAATQWGIAVEGATAAVVQANRVGVDADGRLGRVGGGIALAAEQTVVGGRNAGEGNVVATADNDGIVVTGDQAGPKVIGNLVGVGADGAGAPDGGAGPVIGRFGIVVRQTDGVAPAGARIGGDLPGEGNVVAGAADAQILLSELADGARVAGNLVGLTADGEATVPSPGVGIDAGGTATTIGTGAPEGRNVIAGTEAGAITLDGARGVLVQGNQLGRDTDGRVIGLGEAGIRVAHAEEVVIGERDAELGTGDEPCTGRCNTIEGVEGPAVDVDTSSRAVVVRGNRMAANTGLDVDTGPVGRDPIDHVRGDGLVNRPALVRGIADPQRGEVVVTGTLADADRGLVDVYGHPDATGDELRNGVPVGTVAADDDGRFRLTTDERYPSYSATLTKEGGSTSETGSGCRDVRRTGRIDTDGDALCDEWELAGGVDFDQDGHLDQVLADPDVDAKDLYVELDHMEGAFFDDNEPGLLLGAVANVDAAFEGAPEPIRPHIALDAGSEEVDRSDLVRVGGRVPGAGNDLGDFRDGRGDDPCTGSFGSEDQRESESCWRILGARGAVYRYGLIAHEVDGGDDRLAGADGGRAFATGLGYLSADEVRADAGGAGVCPTVQQCRRSLQESALLHTLGHSLGLRHGGRDDVAAKPNYLSVMNPAFTLPAYVPSRPLDLSRRKLPGLSEGALSEPDGIGLPEQPGTETLLLTRSASTGECAAQAVDAGGPVDFDLDGRTTRTGFAASVNEVAAADPTGLRACAPPDATLETLHGHDDWSALQFDPGTPQPRPATAARRAAAEPFDPLALVDRVDTDGDGVVNADDVCTLVADPGQEDADGDGTGDACLPLLDDRDLSVDLDVTRAAGELALDVRLRNAYPVAATGVRVAVTLPAGFSLTGTPGTGSWDAATGTWSVPAVGPRETVTLRLTGAAPDADVLAVAEVVAAGEPDPDSVPGNGEPREDDRAQRTLAVPPLVGAVDARVGEGTWRARRLRVPVRLSRPAAEDVRVRVRTRDGSATAGEDYVATSRLLTVERGETTARLVVDVIPDALPEADETIAIELTPVHGATAGRTTATATLRDDDAAVAGGDLVPLTCVSGPLDDGPCGTEDADLDAVTDALAVGARDVYATDRARIVRYARDPATHALTRQECWDFDRAARAHPGCIRMDVPGGTTISAATVDQLAVSEDGRTLVAGMRFRYSGQGDGVFAFRRDPATGALTAAGCAGDPIVPAGCLKRALWLGDALLVAPGARHVYLTRGRDVTRVDLDPDTGKATGVTGDLLGDEPRPDGELGAALTPDGGALLLRDAGRVVRATRDPDTGALTETAAAPVPGTGPLALSADGATVYTADSEDRTVRALDAATLVPRGCVGDGTDPDCPVVPAWDDVTGLAAGPEREVYAGQRGGGVLVLRTAVDGTLVGGRCVDPEGGVATCGDERDAAGGGGVQLTADGTAAYALDGTSLHLLLRVTDNGGVNRAPVCADGRSQGQPDEPQTLRLDCADPDGDRLVVAVDQGPAHGGLTTLDPASGRAVYQPAAGYRGEDAVTFSASDGRASSRTARIALSVANAAPVCHGGGGVARTSRPTQLVADCEDADGDPLRYEVVTGPAHGAVGAFDGPFLPYTPQAGYRGEDSVVMRASDPWDASAPVALGIGVGDARPQCRSAGPVEVVVGRETELEVACTDPDGDPVTLALATPGTGGRATLRGTTLRYQAGATVGRERLTVRATDGDGSVGEWHVDVTRRPVPAPARPSCRDDCQPGPDGTVTFRYLCDGVEVTSARYAACQGGAVLIACTGHICRTAGGHATAAGAARKRVLPDVEGRRLAQTKVRVKPGKRAAVRLRLDRGARRQLRRRGRLRVRLVVDVRRLDGTHDRRERVVTLRRPRGKGRG